MGPFHPFPNHTSVVGLAKSIIRLSRNTEIVINKTIKYEAAETVASVDSGFQKLTALLSKTNPPPMLPRIPKPYQIPQGIQDQWVQTLDAASKLSRLSGNSPSPSLLRPQQSSVLSQANATYGTTPPETIWTLLDIICPKSAPSSATVRFVDAGSGMGIPSLAAALFGCHHVQGLELERIWHDEAMYLKCAYDNARRTEIDIVDSNLEFICTDMAIPREGHDVGYFVGANVIFMNSVTWDAALCRSVSERIELDTANSEYVEGGNKGVFVISMSRKLALPSFDLVDILSLDANGGIFTFYVSQRRSQHQCEVGLQSNQKSAVTDSVTMRELRETHNGSLIKNLIALAISKPNSSSLGFLATLATSEPCTRLMSSQRGFSETVIHSSAVEADLPTRASCSMVFRAIVDHAIGKRSFSRHTEVVNAIIEAAGRDDEHPVVRANLLDILGNILYDSPLDEHSQDLDLLLSKVQRQVESEGNENILQAIDEIQVMRQWWRGEQRSLPKDLGSGAPQQ